MRVLLLLSLIAIFSVTKAQTVFADGGMSASRLSLKLTPVLYPSLEGIMNDFFNQTIIGYSVNIGAKYRNRKYYNMYSLAGIVKKAGKRTINLSDYPDLASIGSSEGFDINSLGISKYTVKGELQYLVFSTGIDIKYPIGESFYPYLRIGPHVDYLLDFTNNIQQYFPDLQKELNAVQAGLFLGAGMAYKINRFEIELKSSYLHNFLKIYERKEPTPSKPSVEFNDKTFIFNMGLAFDLKKPENK